MTEFISNAAAIAACNAVVDLVDVGTTNATGLLRIYAGTEPADADAALGGATLLAELAMSNPAFGAAADAAPGATATAAAITDDSAADATGTATFFRIVNRDEVAVIQGTVGITGSGEELEIANTISPDIVAGAPVEVTSLTYTQPES